MNNIGLLFFVCLLQTFPAKHYHAFSAAANGKNVMVDPETANYKDCNIDIYFKGNLVTLGRELYVIYRRERPSDSLMSFFCATVKGRDSIFCSITLLPVEKTKYWYLLWAWGDSTKAFKALAAIK